MKVPAMMYCSYVTFVFPSLTPTTYIVLVIGSQNFWVGWGRSPVPDMLSLGSHPFHQGPEGSINNNDCCLLYLARLCYVALPTLDVNHEARYTS